MSADRCVRTHDNARNFPVIPVIPVIREVSATDPEPFDGPPAIADSRSATPTTRERTFCGRETEAHSKAGECDQKNAARLDREDDAAPLPLTAVCQRPRLQPLLIARFVA